MIPLVGSVAIATGLLVAAAQPGRADEQPEHTTPIHFVLDTNVNTDYYTPRGLLVENEGASFHLLALAILDVYKNPGGSVFNSVTLTGGAWNNFLTHHVGPGPNGTTVSVSPYNEVDPILSLETTVFKSWILGATYVPFISPPNLFPGGAEQNMEFKIAYDDTDLLGPFAVHPALKPFWHFSGPSPVVLGGTQAWDFEFDLSPSVTLFKDAETPLKVSLPFLMAFGNSYWYGGPGTFVGHVAPSLNFSIPFPKAITPPVGFWSFYAGMEYSRIFNNNLFEAGRILSGNNKYDIVIGTGGINVFIP